MNKEQIMSMSEEEIIEAILKIFSNIDDEYTIILAYEVEEKIKEMGLQRAYVNNFLSNLCGNDNFAFFSAIHAAPIDRLRAALLTLEGVKE